MKTIGHWQLVPHLEKKNGIYHAAVAVVRTGSRVGLSFHADGGDREMVIDDAQTKAEAWVSANRL